MTVEKRVRPGLDFTFVSALDLRPTKEGRREGSVAGQEDVAHACVLHADVAARVRAAAVVTLVAPVAAPAAEKVGKLQIFG